MSAKSIPGFCEDKKWGEGKDKLLNNWDLKEVKYDENKCYNAQTCTNCINKICCEFWVSIFRRFHYQCSSTCFNLWMFWVINLHSHMQLNEVLSLATSMANLDIFPLFWQPATRAWEWRPKSCYHIQKMLQEVFSSFFTA